MNDNKLIAMFMGGITSEMSRRIVREHQDIWLPVHGICNWTTTDTGNGKILQYHKSWDWLIPVIDKITSMDVYYIYKSHNSNSISDGGIDINTKYIDVTYNQVIDFIKWYNTL